MITINPNPVIQKKVKSVLPQIQPKVKTVKNPPKTDYNFDFEELGFFKAGNQFVKIKFPR